jgi:hypothetical protein
VSDWPLLVALCALTLAVICGVLAIMLLWPPPRR